MVKLVSVDLVAWVDWVVSVAEVAWVDLAWVALVSLVDDLVWIALVVSLVDDLLVWIALVSLVDDLLVWVALVSLVADLVWVAIAELVVSVRAIHAFHAWVRTRIEEDMTQKKKEATEIFERVPQVAELLQVVLSELIEDFLPSFLVAQLRLSEALFFWFRYIYKQRNHI